MVTSNLARVSSKVLNSLATLSNWRVTNLRQKAPSSCLSQTGRGLMLPPPPTIGSAQSSLISLRPGTQGVSRGGRNSSPHQTMRPTRCSTCNARTGVLSTGSGSVEPKRGEHRQGEKSGHRPVADHAKPLDPPSHEITIGEVAEKYPLLPAAPSAAPLPPAELRYDTDGGLYTRAEFIEEYDGAAEWNAAVRTRPIGV